VQFSFPFCAVLLIFEIFLKFKVECRKIFCVFSPRFS